MVAVVGESDVGVELAGWVVDFAFQLAGCGGQARVHIAVRLLSAASIGLLRESAVGKPGV